MKNYDYKKIIYCRNGKNYTELYYLNNKLHRTDGPAYIYYYEDETICSNFYYLNDKKINVNSYEELEKYIKTTILQ